MFREIEHFLPPPVFHELRYHASTAEFKDVRSPVDGVVYPLIHEDLPNDLVTAIIQAMTLHLKFVPEIRHIFMRRSPEGVEVPNIHHTDNSMGTWSLMLYLDWIPKGGTGFVRNKPLGVAYAPRVEAIVDMLRDCSNDPDAWHLYELCEAEPNKACIFDAGWFHRAEPVGGQGEGVTARTVLTVFYD